MSISLITFVFLLLIIIKRVNGTCNSSEFFPCACCDPSSHYCVHKSTSIFGQFSKCPVFKVFNPSCKLDTSMYCCVPKILARNDARNDNITLFSKYCNKHSNLIDPLMSLVNRIISSCDPISKKCFNARNSVDIARLPKPMVVLPPEDATISILVPEKIIQRNEELNNNNKSLNIIEQDDSDTESNEKQQDTKEEEINTDETTNRAVAEYQSILSLILILIITITLVTIN